MTFLSSLFAELQFVNDSALKADRVPYSFVVSNLRHSFTLDKDTNNAFLSAPALTNWRGVDIRKFKNHLFEAADLRDAQDTLVKTERNANMHNAHYSDDLQVYPAHQSRRNSETQAPS